MNNPMNDAVIVITCPECDSRLTLSVYGWTAVACKCGHHIERSAVCLADEAEDDVGRLPQEWLKTWHHTQYAHIDDFVCELLEVGSASVQFDGSVVVDCVDGFRCLSADEVDRFMLLCEESGDFRRWRPTPPDHDEQPGRLDMAWLRTWHPTQLARIDDIVFELLNVQTVDSTRVISDNGRIDVCDLEGWRQMTVAECDEFRTLCEESVFYTQRALLWEAAGYIDEDWQQGATLKCVQDLQHFAADMFGAVSATLYNKGAIRLRLAKRERLLDQSECDQLIAEFKQAA